MATPEEILSEKAAETATYIDADGKKQTGVLKASIGNKSAKGTGSGSAAALTTGEPETTDYYAGQEALLKTMLDEQQKANQDAADAATAETLAQIAKEQETLNAEYGKSDKQLYRDYRASVRDLPQQLAAMGITGGLSETSRVDLERGYGENLNTSQMERLAAIAELNAQGEAAKRQNDAAAQQQNAAALQNYYNSISALGGQKYNEDMQRAEQGAALLAEQGDFSGYVSLGLVTTEQAELMRKAWIAQNPELARTLGYVSGGEGVYEYEKDPPIDGGEGELTGMQQLYLREAENKQLTDPNWLERMLQQAKGEKAKKDLQAVIDYING